MNVVRWCYLQVYAFAKKQPSKYVANSWRIDGQSAVSQTKQAVLVKAPGHATWYSTLLRHGCARSGLHSSKALWASESRAPLLRCTHTNQIGNMYWKHWSWNLIVWSCLFLFFLKMTHNWAWPKRSAAEAGNSGFAVKLLTNMGSLWHVERKMLDR